MLLEELVSSQRTYAATDARLRRELQELENSKITYALDVSSRTSDLTCVRLNSRLKTLWCVHVVLLEDVVNSATTARVLATRERASPGKVQCGHDGDVSCPCAASHKWGLKCILSLFLRH